MTEQPPAPPASAEAWQRPAAGTAQQAPATQQARHSDWAAEALWQQLLPLLPGLSVEVLAHCDSTNTRLLERSREATGAGAGAGAGRADGRNQGAGDGSAPAAGLVADSARHGQGGTPPHPGGRRAGDLEPALLVAEHQTHGRGRMGRDWQAAAGASLTFSLALPLAPRDWQGLSLAVGLALADALEPRTAAGPARLQLKWPNDLWLCDAPGRGRKLGGVLIETVSLGTQTGKAAGPARRMAVVGVGLNVLPQALDGLGSGYACMQELLPDISAPALLHRVAAPLVRALLDFQRHGFAPLVPAYAHRDLLRGHSVSTTLAEIPRGVAEGVDTDGALCVRAGGELLRVCSGEVSIRLQPGQGAGAAAGGERHPQPAAGVDAPRSPEGGPC